MFLDSAIGLVELVRLLLGLTPPRTSSGLENNDGKKTFSQHILWYIEHCIIYHYRRPLSIDLSIKRRLSQQLTKTGRRTQDHSLRHWIQREQCSFHHAASIPPSSILIFERIIRCMAICTTPATMSLLYRHPECKGNRAQDLLGVPHHKPCMNTQKSALIALSNVSTSV